jgi:6,7-dimethyl-8-ribityllumazine synthase
VALGCVIRGETSHYDIVAGESARGLMELGIRHGALIGNGIITTDTGTQAQVRASLDAPEGKDKGGGAARAALALLQVRRCMEG